MGLIFFKAQSRLEIGDRSVNSGLKVRTWARSRLSQLGLKKWTCSNPKPKKRQLTTEGLEAKFQSNVLRTDKHDHAKEFFLRDQVWSRELESVGIDGFRQKLIFFSPDQEKYFCVSCSFAFLASNWIIAAEADVGKRLIEIQTRRKFKKIPTGRQLVLVSTVISTYSFFYTFYRDFQ